MPGSSHDSQSLGINPARLGTSQPGLIEWANWALGPSGQRPAPHHMSLLQQLEAISRCDIDRLMVLMPPGSAKSTYALAYNAFASHDTSSWTMVPGHGIYDMPGSGSVIYPGSFIADPHSGSQPAAWPL